MALGSIRPLTETSSRNISWGIKAAGAYGWQPYHLHVPSVLKSGSLNLLEPSGSVQACNGIALPLPLSNSVKYNQCWLNLTKNQAFHMKIKVHVWWSFWIFSWIMKFKAKQFPTNFLWIIIFNSDWLRAGWSGDRIPVEARISAPVQTGPGAHPASCTMGTGSFPGVKSGRGVTLTLHPLLVPFVMKE